MVTVVAEPLPSTSCLATTLGTEEQQLGWMWSMILFGTAHMQCVSLQGSRHQCDAAKLETKAGLLLFHQFSRSF